jgi:hypothetical protein
LDAGDDLGVGGSSEISSQQRWWDGPVAPGSLALSGTSVSYPPFQCQLDPSLPRVNNHQVRALTPIAITLSHEP